MESQFLEGVVRQDENFSSSHLAVACLRNMQHILSSLAAGAAVQAMEKL